jgi:hypothetical protein
MRLSTAEVVPAFLTAFSARRLSSEWRRIVVSENAAILLHKFDQITVWVTDENRPDAKIKWLIRRTYRSVFALPHVRLEWSAAMAKQPVNNIF